MTDRNASFAFAHPSRLLTALVVGLTAFAGLYGCGRDLIDGEVPVDLPDAGAAVADTGPPMLSDSGIGQTALSLARVVPDHGPFAGGNTVILRGNGFDDLLSLIHI